jgi:hypothetical protein
MIFERLKDRGFLHKKNPRRLFFDYNFPEMIKFDSFSFQSFDESEPQTPFSLPISAGVTFLPFSQKFIFDALSFSFSDIKSGSFSFGGLEFNAEDKQDGRVYELNVTAADIASIIAVFSLPQGFGNSLSIQREIGKKVRSLRELPHQTEADKRSKLASLCDVLAANGVSYVLIDLNQTINRENKVLLYDVFSGKGITAIFLDEQKANAAAASVSYSKPNSDIPADSVWSFLKMNFLDFLFAAVFAFFGLVGAFIASALFVEAKWGAAVVALLIFIVCLLTFLNDIATIYDFLLKKIRRENDFLAVEAIAFLFSFAGSLIGIGVCFLFAHYGLVIEADAVTPWVIVIASSVACLILFSSFAGRYLAALFSGISSWFAPILMNLRHGAGQARHS